MGYDRHDRTQTGPTETDLIAAAATGAGLAIKSVLPELIGCVQVVGTPAEEAGGGKVLMVDAGVFDGVDAAIMVHPADRNALGRGSLAVYSILVEFFGKPAHSAGSPDQGINALDAVIQTFNGINAIRQHLRDEARIHGIITNGGKAANIVPDYAAAVFGVRAAALPYALEVIAKIRACAQAGALATGARLEFTEPNYYYNAMMPNPRLADLVDANMAALGIEVRLPEARERMGSTDMGNVSQVVPALHPYITICPGDVAGHSEEFRAAAGSPVGHEAMIQAAKVMAMTAVDLLAVPENMAEAKAAFKREKSEQSNK